MTGRATPRGEPVAALLLLVAGWCMARAMLWEAPFPAPHPDAAETAMRLSVPILRRTPRAALDDAPTAPVAPPAQSPGQAQRGERSSDWPLLAERPPSWAPVARRVADGHVVLFAAASAQAEAPSKPAASVQRGRAMPAPIPAFPQLVGDTARASAKRWSGDAWLLLRRDTTTPITSGRGSYGLSQVGAVLRYRIAPANGHRPAAFARASTALADVGGPEVAAGLTGRPLARVPVAFAAEVRASELYSGTSVHPAVFAYSEVRPLKLPLGARGEAYFQGGYVGGRFATPFVDGQMRVDRELARFGPAELRAGGGAWGGAQKGAKRLDVGPGATIALDLDGTPLRMSADWRFRVAGDANPSSGPALTVSTGF
jgi:hypothetical protein